MRVVLVSDSYPPLIGGATRATAQLARWLANRGHRVTVATVWQRRARPFEWDGQVDVHRLRGLVSRVPMLSADPFVYTPPPFPDPELVWRLRRLLREAAPDVVHAYGWLTYSLAAAMRGTQVPLVLAVRDYANICPVRTLIRHGPAAGEICDGPAALKCLRCATSFYGTAKGSAAVAGVLFGARGLRRRAQAVHAVSHYSLATLERTVVHRLPAAEVIPDWRDDGPAEPADPAVLAQLPGEPFVLFVGAFRRIKGDELLLQAYRRMTDPPPLVMIGVRSPDPLPELPPGVTMLFDVPHATVMAGWDRAMFGVFPSLLPEPLGNVVHEAMSRGRAVIGTIPGGHADMIEAGRDGLLVPAGDVDALTRAMQTLIDDPGLRAALGRAARHSAARFTARTMGGRMEALLTSVAGGSPQ